MVNIFLHLENGEIFKGKSFGKVDTVIGELIFNTAMIGYEEIITDPTNMGKALVMSYPIIGSYGFNFEDSESNNPTTTAVICRNISNYPSNFRCEMDADSYFKFYGIVGVEGVDTRKIVKIIRDEGSMKVVISPKLLTETEVKELFSREENNLIYKTTCKEDHSIEGDGENIAVIDLGIKKSLLNYFKSKNFNINIYSANFDYQDILNSKSKFLVLSNGPGNPYDYSEIIEKLKKLIGKIPIISFGVGTDLLTLSAGGELKELPFGHRTIGAAVKDLNKNRIYLTTQNHRNYISKLPENGKIDYINIEDKTVEGYSIESLKIKALHFQPEGSPGPKDMLYVLNDYIDEVLGGKKDA